ncbi:MAG: Wzt carbohydrate-binding domain-containing protein [Candidatus Omnitrophota bacterium]
MTTSLTNSQEKQGTEEAYAAAEVMRVSKQFPLHGSRDKETGVRREDFWALKDISFEVSAGQIFGIIGRNGAGKTTLLNVIVGILSPTEGEVKIKGRVLALFNLGVGFQDELSGKENIFLNGSILGASRKELENKISAIIDFSEIGDFINMPLGTYSQGMRLRLAFSIVANLDFDVLLIDEVLAVGDALFQSKCFERLMDFRRLGKTLIITSQDMGVIERFCNSVLLLDHGRLVFHGAVKEGTDKYRQLLNTEKFYVGIPSSREILITDTKKWVDDSLQWGHIYGAKEVRIDAVRFFTTWGRECPEVASRALLRVKVDFTVRDNIKDPHFGIAFFRKDGVYCYGPNTLFDGYVFPELRKGKGYCILTCKNFMLASGEYRVSVAVWDKNEVIPYDYHNGYYLLKVRGAAIAGDLLNLPWQPLGKRKNILRRIFINNADRSAIISSASSQARDIACGLLKNFSFSIPDTNGKTRDVYLTNMPSVFKCSCDLDKQFRIGASLSLYIGIYRQDGILCQSVVSAFTDTTVCSIKFPRLALLPGVYKISVGIWDYRRQSFLFFRNKAFELRTVFTRPDHGTVYLQHSWKIGGNIHG